MTSETGQIPGRTSTGEANDGVNGDSLKVQIQWVSILNWPACVVDPYLNGKPSLRVEINVL